MQLHVSNALGMVWYEKDSIPAYLAVFKQTEYRDPGLQPNSRCIKITQIMPYCGYTLRVCHTAMVRNELAIGLSQEIFLPRPRVQDSKLSYMCVTP